MAQDVGMAGLGPDRRAVGGRCGGVLAHQALDGASQCRREVSERGREPVEQCNAQRIAGLALEHFEKTTRLIIVAMQHDLMNGLMRAVPAELSDRAKGQW